MNNPDETPSALAAVLATLSDNGGLVGQFIGKEAAKALSSVIGSALKVPDAYFSSIAKGILSDADAKAHVKALIASEVGRRAVIDDALVDRMSQRWMGDQVAKQINREAVAFEAAADLKEAPPEADLAVDEEFLARFNTYAENATTEQMQKLFGRVLAGEIRTPGTFSLATLHTLSMIDQRVAKVVETVAPWVLSGFFPGDGEFGSGTKFALGSVLEEAGLCHGLASRVRSLSAKDGRVLIPFELTDGAPMLYLNTEKDTLQVSITPLTSVGQQVFALANPQRTDETTREVALALLNTAGVSSIEFGAVVVKAGQPMAGPSKPFEPPLDTVRA
jgi:hypothetical protein